MGFAIYPKYNDVYDGQIPSVTELLKDISSQTIINVACYINVEKHVNFLDLKVDLRLFEKMVERLNIEIKTALIKKIGQFSINIIGAGQQVTIFPLPSILKLIEHELTHFKEGGFDEITNIQEENILKAILVLNQIEEEEYVREANKRKTNNEFETFISWVWPNLLPNIEFQGRKEFLLPLSYSIKFFEYLNNVEKFKPFLKRYLENSKISSYKEYLKKLLEFYINSYNKNDQRFHFKFDYSILKLNSVISEYILDIATFDSFVYVERALNKNYKQLREKPIIKFSDGSLCITNWNFFIDKYYQAQKFDFFNLSGVQEIYNGNANQKFQTFNGEIGFDFIEKRVFLETMHKYLPLSGGIVLEEDLQKGWNQDLYYRFNNNICFVEFKSVGLPVSNDFNEIKKSVDDERKIKKAVIQLVEQIRGLSKNIDKFENLSELGIKKEELIIHTSIVYTDIAWSTSGINEYFNRLFRAELRKEQFGFFSINDITMIHIDFFFEYEKIFLEDKTSFHLVLWKHYMQRAIYVEQYRRIPNAITATEAYAPATFYLHNAFKEKRTNVLNNSLYNAMIMELGIPQS
jgi:hypothetical protein